MVFKLVDPVIQSLLLIYFIYSTDSNTDGNTDMPYTHVMLYLLGVQALSYIINIFIKAEEQNRKERFFFALCAIGYAATVLFIAYKSTPNLLVLLGPLTPLSMLKVGILGSATCLSFWYFTICVREIRDMLPDLSTD